MRQMETRQMFAIAEESMAAWCIGEKTLGGKGRHGNCLKTELGKKAEPASTEERFHVSIRQ